jgi:hypothetical protein
MIDVEHKTRRYEMTLRRSETEERLFKKEKALTARVGLLRGGCTLLPLFVLRR